MRRGDEAHVDLDRTHGPDGDHLALLEDAKERRLRRHRQVADLVEEERAPVGGAHEAELVPHRARERAAHVPEQERLEE